ncbi:MAG TPA: hypothetical protein PK659_05470 [Methanothrix sp.]|nr:hypothetical protein [Methanothrix sp.]HOL43684.1 hypothetical protein [Methanothrix sp.]
MLALYKRVPINLLFEDLQIPQHAYIKEALYKKLDRSYPFDGLPEGAGVMLCARFDLPPTAPKGFDEAETVKPFDAVEGVAMNARSYPYDDLPREAPVLPCILGE